MRIRSPLGCHTEWGNSELLTSTRAGSRNPPLRVVRMSGASFRAGIEVHRIEGQRVQIYGVAKTIADLFKFRKRIGLEVALEALRDAWQRRLVTMDEVERFARACRVVRVTRPYIETLVA